MPQIGEIVDGYGYVGGDPASEKSWLKLGTIMDGHAYNGGDPSSEKSWLTAGSPQPNTSYASKEEFLNDVYQHPLRKDVASGMTPEQVQEHLKKTSIKMGRANSPELAKFTDAVSGMANSMRGGLNLIKQGLGEKVFPSDTTDKTSTDYTVGKVLDPILWVIGGGAAKAMPYAPVLGSGFTNGLSAVLRNATAGGIAGGAIAGLDDDGANVSTGAQIGAAVGVGLPVLTGAVGAIGRKVADLPLPGRNYDQMAMRILREKVLNDLTPRQVKNLLTSASNAKPRETLGQAAANLDIPSVGALDKFSQFRKADAYARDIVKPQQVASLRALDKISKGPVERDSVSKMINTDISQMYDDALNSANTSTSTYRKVSDDLGKAKEEALSLLQGGRQYPQARATAIKVMSDERGGSLPISVATEMFPEATKRVMRAKEINSRNMGWAGNVARDRQWDRAIEYAGAGKDIEERAARAVQVRNMLEDDLSKALPPLNGSSLISKIQSMRNKPDILESGMESKLIDSITQNISSKIDKSGYVPAETIAKLYRTAVNDTLLKLNAGTDTNAKKEALAAMLKIKPMLSEAIDASAGNNQFTKANSAFEQAMRKLDAMSVGDRLKGKLVNASGKEDLGAFATELRKMRNETDDIGNPVLNVLEPQQFSALDKIQKRAEVQTKLAEQAKLGMSSVSDKLGYAIEKDIAGTVPNFMNPKITFINSLLRRVGLNGKEHVDDAVAELMRNPKEFAMLWKTVEPRDKVILNKLITERMRAPVGMMTPKDQQQNQ